MAGRRRELPARSQIALPWTDPRAILDRAARRGSVVFEAPEAPEVVRERVPRVPRVRAPKVEPPSLGLPFGVRIREGRVTCWSCAQDLAEPELIEAGPGAMTCPGCGARLPFAE